MTARRAPKPWDEAYRHQGRLWRGARLDGPTLELLEAWPALAAGRWFDAGCGDGKGLAPLAQRVARVDAADASRWALRRAREVTAVPLLQADARAWPLRDQAYDAVRAVHLLGHLDPEGQSVAATEVRRLLRPQGVAVVCDFGRGDFRHGTGEAIGPHTFRRGVGVVTHYFDIDSYRTLLSEAGLEIIRIETERFDVRYAGSDLPRERVWAWARA